MGLFAPLALAALSLLGVVIALYLLKLRRPVAPVASLHLWDSLTRDREANSLWQRLHVSSLLILQLLALTTLVLALARPWVPSAEAVDQHAVIVIDTSASMGSTDVGDGDRRTRLQAARDKAISIVDGLPQNGTAALITADDNATLRVPSTDDKARLRDEIHRLLPNAAGSDMVEAMKLAGAIVARQEHSVVWVLSDGAFPPTGGQIGNVSAIMHYFKVGRGESNQGISAMSLQRVAGSTSLFVQVVNSGSFTVSRRLDFRVDDEPWSARTVSIGPQSSSELLVEDVPLTSRVIEAQLAGTDSLALDDAAWVVNRGSTPANVLLVTHGNKFLELALSLLPTVNLYKVDPADYKLALTVNGAPVHLTVLDAGVPSNTLKLLPAGNVLLIAPSDSSSLIQVSGVITEPQVVVGGSMATGGAAGDQTEQTKDPLLRFVDLSSLHVAIAQLLKVPAWGTVVVNSDKGPLVIAGEPEGRKVAVLAFDLHDSDLPLQSAYPLLMRNLVSYLLPDPSGGLPTSVTPGDAVGINAAIPGVDRVLVEDPSGKEWTYPISSERSRAAFAATGQPGVYYVTQYGGTAIKAQEAFAVNLFSRDESIVPPNAFPGLPEGVSAQGAAASPGAQAAAAEEESRRELWPIVALGGVLLLLLEWLYAQRIAIRRAVTELRARRAISRLERS